jgi:hypothetical protein
MNLILSGAVKLLFRPDGLAFDRIILNEQVKDDDQIPETQTLDVKKRNFDSLLRAS